MSEMKITRAHGSGGLYTHRLIQTLFQPKFSNPALNDLLDGALIQNPGGRIVFTTDSHVVKPLFFPGGDIGSLAVNGTINDLAVCGAKPLYLSCGFIIEEGFAFRDLERIVDSMYQSAQMAGVQIVTGDTKVVGRGEADQLFINTSGIGVITSNIRLHPDRLAPGDQVIVSGYIGDHEAAIIQTRLDLPSNSPLQSDCAPLNTLIAELLNANLDIKLMRDPTRGGLATTLNEFVNDRDLGIIVDETAVPIRDTVRGLCEPLGFDPLYLACEGKVVLVVAAKDAERALTIMRNHRLGQNAAIIGEVVTTTPGKVLLQTLVGTHRILDMLTGEMLPRIC